MMKILYDHQIYQHQRTGGISRYFTEIIKHLPKDVEYDVSVAYAFNEYLKDINVNFKFADQINNAVLPNHRFKGQLRMTALLERFIPSKYPNRYQANKDATIRKIKEGEFDIFHPTFFDDYYLDIIQDKPFVLTVHDMILELYPELTYSLGFVTRKKKLVEKATHIIAVSENTKLDLINIFDVAPEKISVIYHASSLPVSKKDNAQLLLPEKYILYVGDRRLGYKNFLFFITSVVPILMNNSVLDIFCVGNQFTDDEKYFFRALGIENRIKQDFVADEDLYTVYNRAEMFVYPSYYEGFGIPILEAFQAKCPVVLADASCFREVAEDAALYFRPKSLGQLRENIISLLSNSMLREKYIAKGLERLSNFSWEKSALHTVGVYKQILKKG